MIKLAVCITTIAVVSACAINPSALPQDQRSARVQNATTSDLCASYSRGTSDALGNQMIEAELVVRGITQCWSRPLGQATARAFGQAIYDRSGAVATTGVDYDCSDFASAASAQRFFLASGGPFSDQHDLDRDGDGLACEWGTEIRQIANSRPAVRISTPTRPRQSSLGRCYTGPRGGTYTITASGNRNYDGC
ncbi:hypothetical protein GTA62_19635 [Roseobacter sp. HKCCD9010]|uniref:excalibur calcium-binding domain-containing protein n=2 Tax=unclassified Roseobacter TaxID=196798 RepID=UPI0014915715|nr:hypothetical protein [Rhodobacterales bacterium HKCCD4356]NNV14131.1 hypothetical protein [Roseobacter sp. HKCCD7357]NNV18355.1 hypothetical protein [Roseobacter sp. HKCCD8768]NNV27795.1 hypothetical protein [Roseobacter sp. HKCCD8192]NNV32101.1 hypothetical protein [Roseobacter sp. HKCCD9061]NNV36509.1 hypothetical protein [Roseobacter sp. HKCCD9073]NNV40582.1 hypothetical protein [Roseobacter sp. HKCCD9054]NNV44809.1 hypothetical protein [Roseobacter sp. HKCCD6497]NNV49119.1 hypothetic